MTDIAELSKMMQTEGAKRGYTPDQINKTIKLIKKGKINLESLAPMITEKLTDGLKTDMPSRNELKNRLHKKITERAGLRLRKKDVQNKTETKDQESSTVHNKNKCINTKKNQNKKLNKLAKKYGTISAETYFDALKHIKEHDALNKELSHEAIIENNRYKNIIAIYDKQNRPKVITNLSDDDEYLSDISD